MLFPNGDSYEGDVVGDKPNGFGTYRWADGSVYRGSFKNGLRHGHGLWKSRQGNVYEGHYVNDRRQGQGKYLWPSGTYYEGTFFCDLRQGYGVMVWSDGLMYKGSWNEGKKHGQGTLYQNDRIIQEGYFENDFFVRDLKHFRTRSSFSQDREQQFQDYINSTISYSQEKERMTSIPKRPKFNRYLKLKKLAIPWVPNGISTYRRQLYQ